MTERKNSRGIAIALAWPETYCKQVGGWYEFITEGLGIKKNNYYKAGHAALILVESGTGICRYFDFGRYHAPFRHGRVRSASTDDDLVIHAIARFSGNGSRLENFNEILDEVRHNPACHGEGAFYASYTAIDFPKAFAQADSMQKSSPILYGPFEPDGTNCSRFVNRVLLAGLPDLAASLRLKFIKPLTPTPMNNVNALRGKQKFAAVPTNNVPYPVCKRNKQYLMTTLPEPERHKSIPADAQWLSGEGCGSWFALDWMENHIHITRFSPGGHAECSGNFELHHELDKNRRQEYKVTYLTNCKSVTLELNNKLIMTHRIEKPIIH